MEFHIGDKVVCVNKYGWYSSLTLGKLYTILGIDRRLDGISLLILDDEADEIWIRSIRFATSSQFELTDYLILKLLRDS